MHIQVFFFFFLSYMARKSINRKRLIGVQTSPLHISKLIFRSFKRFFFLLSFPQQNSHTDNQKNKTTHEK